MKKSNTIVYCCLILTFTLWGSLYVVSKYTLGSIPTFTISFVRFGLAFLSLSFITGKKSVKIQKEDYKYFLLVGVAGYFVAVGSQLLGIKYAGASLASLLNAMNPITTIVFAAMFLKEKLTLQKIMGILLSVAGVVIILGGGVGNQEGMLSGICYSLVSVLLWSGVSVAMRRLTQKYEPIFVTKTGAGIASLCYLPICIIEVISGEELSPNISSVAALLYIGIICTGVAYFLWNKCLSMAEAGTCSSFYPIQPMVSALFGFFFLGEVISTSFVAGAICIICGVLVGLSKMEFLKHRTKK